jgi:hypothetical protein
MEKRLLVSTQEGIEKIQKIVDDMLHFAKPKVSISSLKPSTTSSRKV